LRESVLEDASRALTTWKALADSFRPAVERAARTIQRLEQMKATILTVHGRDLARVATLAAPPSVIGRSVIVDEDPAPPAETIEVVTDRSAVDVPAITSNRDMDLAHRLADRLRIDPHLGRQGLALEVKEELESLGRLQPLSTALTAKRRLQQFLNELVYGRLISIDELPPRVRRGVLTGGTRDTRQA